MKMNPDGTLEGSPTELAEYMATLRGPVAPVVERAFANRKGRKPVREIKPDLTPKQFAVVHLLRSIGPVHRCDIMEELNLTDSAADNHLYRLSARGILRRDANGWGLTEEAKKMTFTPTRSEHGIAAIRAAESHAKLTAVPDVPETDKVPTTVLSLCLYDVVQTMLEYGEPLKAPGIATLMGLSTPTVSGRLEHLKAKGIIEQYPNHKTWRIVPERATYSYLPERIG